jgi:protein subunit release factor B
MFFLFKAKSDGNGGSHVNRTPSQIKAILYIAGAFISVATWFTNQTVAYARLKDKVEAVCSESRTTKSKVDSMYTDIAVVKTDVRWIRQNLEVLNDPH